MRNRMKDDDRGWKTMKGDGIGWKKDKRGFKRNK